MSTKRSSRKSRVFVTLGVAMAMVLSLSISAWAAHANMEISIPLTTHFTAAEGSVTELATEPVPEGFADHLCEVRAHSENQHSVHPGNNILVESGTSQVILPDVEAEPGKVIDSDDMLELGETITVSLIMGPDEIFSAGIDVVVECHEEEPQVEPTVESTSTTVAVVTTDTPATEATEATTAPSIEDEVKGTEVLPFTGPQDSQLGLLALALLAGGTLLVVGTRRSEE